MTKHIKNSIHFKDRGHPQWRDYFGKYWRQQNEDHSISIQAHFCHTCVWAYE